MAFYRFTPARQLLKGIRRVRLTGEPAVGPGVLLDWFSAVSRQFGDQDRGLFYLGDTEPHYFRINPNGRSVPNWQDAYRTVGRMMALSLIHEVPLGVDLPLSYYARLLGEELTEEQVSTFEPNIIASFNLMRTWTDGQLAFVPMEIMGEEHVLTTRNREFLFRQKIDNLIDESVIDQFRMIAEGFTEMIPEGSFRGIAKADNMKHIILGETVVDVDDMMAHAVYENGWDANHQIVQWLWEIIQAMTREERRKLLRFITGTSTVPVGGFANLHQPIIISQSHATADHFPSAHTCTFTLDVPEYQDIETMRARFMVAIDVDNMGFI